MRWQAWTVGAAWGLVACGSGPDEATDGPTSAPQAAASAAESAAEGLGGAVLPGRGQPLTPTAGAAADGAPCRAAQDCASGICEGQGCDGDGPKCAPAQRMCTKDLRSYCGCDGKTFMTSGSCPGRPYAQRGACADDPSDIPPAAKAGGAPCTTGKDCASGVCEGQGCDGAGPVCRPVGAMCTMDLVPYCGCNGVTFKSSGTCPGRPFASKGPCVRPAK